jgi:hypothetical protein
LQLFLRTGFNLNVVDADTFDVAVRTNRSHAILLLNAGLRPNHEQTIDVMRRRDSGMLDVMIRNGAVSDIALRAAAWEQWTEAVRKLIDTGGGVESDSRKYDVAAAAAGSREALEDTSTLRFLLDHGVEPRSPNSNMPSLLVLAANAPSPARVRLLLGRGAKVTARDLLSAQLNPLQDSGAQQEVRSLIKLALSNMGETERKEMITHACFVMDGFP